MGRWVIEFGVSCESVSQSVSHPSDQMGEFDLVLHVCIHLCFRFPAFKPESDYINDDDDDDDDAIYGLMDGWITQINEAASECVCKILAASICCSVSKYLVCVHA